MVKQGKWARGGGLGAEASEPRWTQATIHPRRTKDFPLGPMINPECGRRMNWNTTFVYSTRWEQPFMTPLHPCLCSIFPRPSSYGIVARTWKNSSLPRSLQGKIYQTGTQKDMVEKSHPHRLTPKASSQQSGFKLSKMKRTGTEIPQTLLWQGQREGRKTMTYGTHTKKGIDSIWKKTEENVPWRLHAREILNKIYLHHYLNNIYVCIYRYTDTGYIDILCLDKCIHTQRINERRNWRAKETKLGSNVPSFPN